MALNTTGVVLRIEKTSVHDGPGLRTVVFLKGCPLSCAWCSTPESQHALPEKGYSAERCVGCATCVSNCPNEALSLIDGAVVTDTDLCINCFRCVDVCPHSAHKGYGRIMTVSQVVEEISKDEIFFFHSGGGVTISGGECFTQAVFTCSILKECRQRGIDTAVETSLLAPWQSIEKSLPFLNTIYVDIKHHDSIMHRELTGVGNQTLITHLAKLDESTLPFALHLRIPLIPGINDDDENLEEILLIAESLEKVQEIELLPYHRLGVATYALLGKKYGLDCVLPPSEEYLAERLAFIRKKSRSVLLKGGGASF